ncbi:hypothetical protein [Rhizobium bangladeshense]|uniref:hypothetical protein n=1 Tax=Rhizobium bangladeshense TaxID=1138189 RepID=UPI001C91C2DF|nr:hypothetical protein [Rhizobium bangladeshense]MBY3597591.1 hypothetical protein [Rhizobium bangladeshense]
MQENIRPIAPIGISESELQASPTTPAQDHLRVARSMATMIDANLEAAIHAGAQQSDGALRDAIASYFAGHGYLDSLPNGAITYETEPFFVEEHLEVHARRLIAWEAAAENQESALAALRVVHHDMDGFGGNPLAAAMFTAAVAFYEREEGVGQSARATLQSLIAAHRKAHAAFSAAVDEKEAADQAFRKAFEGKLYKGPFTTSYEMKYGMEWVQEQVSTEIAWYREKFKMLARIDPDAHEVALGALNAGEEKHLSAIAEAFADEKTKIDLVEDQYDQLSDAEREALSEILDHRCATMEEIRLKADYLSSDHLRGALNDPWCVEGLLRSMKD